MDTLTPGRSLLVGDSLESADSRFSLLLQDDGNLVLYRLADGIPLRATQTQGYVVGSAIMQTDGNFVLYTPPGVPVWASNTEAFGGSSIPLQNDGNLVVYQGSTARWASGSMFYQFGAELGR